MSRSALISSSQQPSPRLQMNKRLALSHPLSLPPLHPFIPLLYHSLYAHVSSPLPFKLLTLYSPYHPPNQTHHTPATPPPPPSLSLPFFLSSSHLLLSSSLTPSSAYRECFRPTNRFNEQCLITVATSAAAEALSGLRPLAREAVCCHGDVPAGKGCRPNDDPEPKG